MSFRAQQRREQEYREARERAKQPAPARTRVEAALEWLSTCERRSSHRYNRSASSRAVWLALVPDARESYERAVDAASDAKLAREGRVELEDDGEDESLRNVSPFDPETGEFHTRSSDIARDV